MNAPAQVIRALVEAAQESTYLVQSLAPLRMDMVALTRPESVVDAEASSEVRHDESRLAGLDVGGL